MGFFAPKLGWMPDSHDSRDWDVDRLCLGQHRPASTGSEKSLREYAPPVFDQGRTSTCVGQSVSAAMSIRECRVLGEDQDVPSRLSIYWLARTLHGAEKRDAGTYIRLATKASFLYGVPDERHWGFSRSNVNRQPSWASMMQGHQRKGGSYYRIRDGGDKRCEAICAAIDDGYPVVNGIRVARQ